MSIWRRVLCFISSHLTQYVSTGQNVKCFMASKPFINSKGQTYMWYRSWLDKSVFWPFFTFILNWLQNYGLSWWIRLSGLPFSPVKFLKGAVWNGIWMPVGGHQRLSVIQRHRLSLQKEGKQLHPSNLKYYHSNACAFMDTHTCQTCRIPWHDFLTFFENYSHIDGGKDLRRSSYSLYPATKYRSSPDGRAFKMNQSTSLLADSRRSHLFLCPFYIVVSVEKW